MMFLLSTGQRRVLEMNFQYYRAPGLVPAGAVPVLGAATSLLGQPLAPRGFMPAQGQVSHLLDHVSNFLLHKTFPKSYV